MVQIRFIKVVPLFKETIFSSFNWYEKAGAGQNLKLVGGIVNKCRVKHLKGYATIADLLIGLIEYFVLYNTERPHQSLGYDTPDQVYRAEAEQGL